MKKKIDVKNKMKAELTVKKAGNKKKDEDKKEKNDKD